MKKIFTKEEKELLIKDLLLRTQTDVMVKVPGEDEPKELRKRVRWMITFSRVKSVEDCLEGLIPYLRPLSDMTEDEICEFEELVFPAEEDDDGNYQTGVLEKDIPGYIDWLILHHFDFRGMIEKDLAIKAEKGMYK